MRRESASEKVVPQTRAVLKWDVEKRDGHRKGAARKGALDAGGGMFPTPRKFLPLPNNKRPLERAGAFGSVAKIDAYIGQTFSSVILKGTVRPEESRPGYEIP